MRDIMIRSGYFDAQWRKYENGGSLNLNSVMRVCLGLGVTLSELFDRLGQWPRMSVTEIQVSHGIVSLPEAESDASPETTGSMADAKHATSKRVQGKAGKASTKQTEVKKSAAKASAAGSKPAKERKRER